MGVFDWKALEQDRIDQAEDRGICPDPESQGQNCHRCKHGTFGKHSQAVADILDQCFHKLTYSYLSATSGSTWEARLAGR